MTDERAQKVLDRLDKHDQYLDRMQEALDAFGEAQRAMKLSIHEMREEIRDAGIIFQRTSND